MGFASFPRFLFLFCLMVFSHLIHSGYPLFSFVCLAISLVDQMIFFVYIIFKHFSIPIAHYFFKFLKLSFHFLLNLRLVESQLICELPNHKLIYFSLLLLFPNEFGDFFALNFVETCWLWGFNTFHLSLSIWAWIRCFFEMNGVLGLAVFFPCFLFVILSHFFYLIIVEVLLIMFFKLLEYYYHHPN